MPPELTPWQRHVLDAFYRLSSERQLGFGVGPIPWSAVQRWMDCDPRIIDKADRLSFDYLIANLDREDRKLIAEAKPTE